MTLKDIYDVCMVDILVGVSKDNDYGDDFEEVEEFIVNKPHKNNIDKYLQYKDCEVISVLDSVREFEINVNVLVK